MQMYHLRTILWTYFTTRYKFNEWANLRLNFSQGLIRLKTKSFTLLWKAMKGLQQSLLDTLGRCHTLRLLAETWVQRHREQVSQNGVTRWNSRFCHHCNHRQTPRPRNRPRDRTTNFTERRNRQNSIHTYLPPTEPCYQKCHSHCPFISNTVKISGTNRSVKVTVHFTCISTNVIYCITCTLCKKIYIGETGRRLADRFREHLRDAEQSNTDAPKPVARHFNLPNHSHHNMTICGLFLHRGNTESRKNLEQKLIFQLGTLSPHGINERLSLH